MMTHNSPMAPKEVEETNNDKTNVTYETTDAQTKNCNRGTALERSLGKLQGDGLNQFY